MGQSTPMSTMPTYFSGKRELFKGLAMEELERKRTVYPAPHLDLNTGKYDSEDSLFKVLDDFPSKPENDHGTFHSETHP